MSKKRTILLVEDNPKIMEANRRALKPHGYNLLEAETLEEAQEHLDRQIPDVIVLDIQLPDGNGLDFIPEIRTVTSAPILLLTAMGKITDRIRGLRAGGDDYIAKPYNVDEFCERVAAFIRRGNTAPEKITHGPLTMDLTAQRACLSDVDMQLTQKEFALLLLLIKKSGKVLTKEYVYEKVWGQPISGDCNAFYALVKRLKKKLEQHENIEFYVSRNEGYCLNILGCVDNRSVI